MDSNESVMVISKIKMDTSARDPAFRVVTRLGVGKISLIRLSSSRKCHHDFLVHLVN